MREEIMTDEEENTAEESKGRSYFMDDTTLIDFSGVIIFTLVLWFSSNIYLALAFFALTLFFWEKGFAVFQVTHFAISDQQNNFLPSECLPEHVSRLKNI